MEIQTSTIVPWPQNLSRRLYESLLFLCCLIVILPKENHTTAPDLEGVAEKGPKEAFRCFVNKLAQVCDNERGGNTVTSFAVLQPGSTEYRFASNRRDGQALAKVGIYVTDLLETLGNAPDQVFSDASQRSKLHSEVLGKVLAFNRPRIQIYLRALVNVFDFCIEGCTAEGASDGLSIADDLQSIKLSTLRAQKCLMGSESVDTTRSLLQAINQCYQGGRFQDFMREKTREDREEANETPWTKLYHFLGRFHSFSIAVNVFLSTRSRWPELFEAFEVTYIPSNKPTNHPPPSLRRSASGIVDRLSKDREVLNNFPDFLDSYNLYADYLQERGLDTEIKKKAKPKSFSPTVHAEVNLSHSILREERTHGRVRFFNESVFGRYIGASKPTCRLCDLYFHAPSGPGIEVRKSHNNAYYNWGYPDVYVEDGLAAQQTRKTVLESMVLSVKLMAAKTLSERFVVGKRYDTNTTTTDPVGVNGGVGSVLAVDDAQSVQGVGFDGGWKGGEWKGHVSEEVMDDLASIMGQVDLDLSPGQGVVWADPESEDEDDGDEGGVRL